MSVTIARVPVAEPPCVNACAPRGGDARSSDGSLLPRTRIGHRFSLVEHDPLTIAAEPGLIVRVRSGSIWGSQPGDGECCLARAGESLAARRSGWLVVHAVGRSEIEIELPQPGDERPSPGLEPITIVP
ncbi:MAG: hypothetical protein U1F45_07145 [Burkholderiales bacterium]